MKSDNILIRLKQTGESNQCGSGKNPIDVYLIDFGNAILNMNRRNSRGEAILHQSQFRVKKYFMLYRAPEITCQFEQAPMPQMLTWYLGVIAFEMCTNGAQIHLAPTVNVCHSLRSREYGSRNSLEMIVKPRHSVQASLKFCYEPKMAGYLRKALVFNPTMRISSDNLVRIKLTD